MRPAIFVGNYDPASFMYVYLFLPYIAKHKNSYFTYPVRVHDKLFLMGIENDDFWSIHTH